MADERRIYSGGDKQYAAGVRKGRAMKEWAAKKAAKTSAAKATHSPASSELPKIRTEMRREQRTQRKEQIRRRRHGAPRSTVQHSRTGKGKLESLRVQDKAARHNVRVNPRQAASAVDRSARRGWRVGQFGRGGPRLPGVAVMAVASAGLQYIKTKGRQKRMKAKTKEGSKLRWEAAYRQGRGA